MKKITESEYKKAVEAATAAMEAIPTGQNRKATKTYHDTLAREIAALEGEEVESAKGLYILYTSRDNLGTSKWPDMYTRIKTTWSRCEKETPKMCDKVKKSNIIAVMDEEIHSQN